VFREGGSGVPYESIRRFLLAKHTPLVRSHSGMKRGFETTEYRNGCLAGFRQATAYTILAAGTCILRPRRPANWHSSGRTLARTWSRARCSVTMVRSSQVDGCDAGLVSLRSETTRCSEWWFHPRVAPRRGRTITVNQFGEGAHCNRECLRKTPSNSERLPIGASRLAIPATMLPKTASIRPPPRR
jgi:hypothetical protein